MWVAVRGTEKGAVIARENRKGVRWRIPPASTEPDTAMENEMSKDWLESTSEPGVYEVGQPQQDGVYEVGQQ